MTTAKDLVNCEVYYCVSCLVSDLASGYGERLPGGDLADLTEEAFELCSPVLDYEEAALQEGFVEESDGSWTRDEDIYDSAEEVCDMERLDPYEREVFEHWLVSDWLWRELRDRGERVGELAGMKIWGRTTTGQAIAHDSVIESIVAALNAK